MMHDHFSLLAGVQKTAPTPLLYIGEPQPS